MALFRIAFSRDFTSSGIASVLADESLPEYQHVWVWDVYYAHTIHVLAQTQEASSLTELLEGWAVNMAPKMLLPDEDLRQAARTELHYQLTLTEQPLEDFDRSYTIKTTDTGTDWPAIELELPETAPTDEQIGSVIALMDYFMDRNTLFVRELPVHILAYRKYYADVRSPNDPYSVEEGPVFALAKAGELFQELSGDKANG